MKIQDFGSAQKRGSAELGAFQRYSAALQVMTNPNFKIREKGYKHVNQSRRND